MQALIKYSRCDAFFAVSRSYPSPQPKHQIAKVLALGKGVGAVVEAKAAVEQLPSS